MADAAWLQTSFLGGEVAPSFQGRADHPKYKSGLNKSFNALPVETGSWQRRPGTRQAALTRAGVYAKIIDFDFSQNAPFTAEFTDSHLRFFSTYSLVHTFDSKGPEVVQSISTANPAIVTVNGNTEYTNGDMVEFSFPNVDFAPDEMFNLNNRQFLIGEVSGNTFALYDPVQDYTIDGSTISFVAGTPCLVQRILDIPTPWVRQMLDSIRCVQASNNGINTMVIFHPQVPPQALTATDPPNPDFVLNAGLFLDGPYLDPPSVGNYIGVSGTSGTITLTASTTSGINSDTGFQPTDVGRSIRLLSQPADWDSGTTYAEGDLVTYQGAYYSALVGSNTGNVPGTDAVNWGVATNANAWVWGIISAVSSTTVVTCELQTVNTATLQLPGVLVNGNNIPDTNYRLGLYSDTTTYPACGTYTEGRLCLGGAAKNRFDMSVSNDIFNFSPTAVDGTVSDNNAIAYTFNAKDLNTIFWMTPQQTGVIMGTQAGEWLVQASTNGDVLTPTSIQAKRVTKYGDANVEPIDAPFATLFVERNNKKVLEYLADVFTGKYSAINVTLTGSHLTAPGCEEIRYQKELVPCMWARMADGSLAGMTYRRESPMLSEQPAFSGWHSHALGTGRSVTSIAVGPNVTGDLDSLSMVTYDPVLNTYQVELMTDMFPDDGTNLDAWYVDGGTTPSGAFLAPTTLTLYGLAIYEGQVLSAYIAGIDCGDFTVTNGEIVIPVPGGNNDSGLLTQAALAAANNLTAYGPAAMPVTYDQSDFPVAAASVQAYILSSPVSAAPAEDTVLMDLPNNRVFIFSQGNGVTDGISVFNISTGAMINSATHTQIFGPNPLVFVDSPYTLGHDGFIYTTSGPVNSSPYIKIDPNTLRIVGFAGEASSTFDLTPTTIPFPANMAAASCGGKYFVVSPSLVYAVNGTINVVEMTEGSVQNAGSAFNPNAAFSTTDVQALSGPAEPGSGIVYTVGWGSGTDTKGLNFYRTLILPQASGFNLSYFPTVQNPDITTIHIGGTLTPADIDATWTHIAYCSAPIYDHSDGNLIFDVWTNDSVTNKEYLMKINAASGAIIWQTGFTSAPHVVGLTSEGAYNPTSMYVAGFMGFYSGTTGTWYLNILNTGTGTFVSTALPGFVPSSGQVWDSRLAGIIGVGSTSIVTGAPTPLNGTPTTFIDQWCRIIVNPSQLTQGRQFYIVPACVGKTYTSQGQMLRALDPQSTGARNGPAMGKTRRNHRLAMLLLNSAGIQFGGDFSHLHTALFKSKGGTPYVDNQLFSGVFSDTVEDDYSYDGMLCWQITRPYPANVLAAEPMLQTQDR